MEYLTLHDIPQRHCNPVQSHRMASQSSERPAAHMAAVCDIFSFHSTFDPEKRPLFLPPHSPRSSELSAQVSASRKNAPKQHLPLREITLPELSPTSPSTPSGPYRSRPLSSLDGTMGLHRLPDYPSNKACTLHDWNEYLDWCSTKTASQAHLQRSSPPLQPGEQNFPGKLPSFDEVSTIRKLTLHHANPCSSSKPQLKGPLPTHRQGETSPRRAPHMCALSLMM